MPQKSHFVPKSSLIGGGGTLSIESHIYLGQGERVEEGPAHGGAVEEEGLILGHVELEGFDEFATRAGEGPRNKVADYNYNYSTIPLYHPSEIAI